MDTRQLLSIPEKFLLMLLNEQTGYFYQVPGWTLNCAVTGAVLAELSLQGRIDTDEKSLFVLDDRATGVPMLDLCLAEIVADAGQRDTRFWIERLAVHSERIIDTTLDHLTTQGVLTHHDGGFYTFTSGLLGDRDDLNIKARMDAAIFADAIPDPEVSLILCLLKACDVVRFIFDLTEVHEERVAWICQIEVIGRVIATGVEKALVHPVLLKTPLSRKIPAVSLASLLANRHLLDGNLPALMARLADRYGPVFRLRSPFHGPLIFVAGRKVNRWMHRNARRHMTSGNYFRGLEGACGAQSLITSLDGADHFRLRKVMRNIYAPAKFDERATEMCQLTRQFMGTHNWQAGTAIPVKRDTRLLINMQMTNITVSTDTQDIFEELCKWKERASNVHVGQLLPRFMARTPAMRQRFRLLHTFVRRIEQNHTPVQRRGACRELADDLISLHDSDPQFLPEQNLPFMLAAAPILQSMYVGDLLGFALYELARHPLLAARIREEATEIFANGGINGTAFSESRHDVTRRFLMECLRLYPVVAMQVRNVANSCVIEGYSLPLGERVHIVQTAPHYMKDCFENPYRFDIDRYLPSRKEHQSVTYAPYGLGTHLCVGADWMRLQMLLSILLIVYHYELAPLPATHKLRISPFPTLSVTQRLRVGIARQLHEVVV